MQPKSIMPSYPWLCDNNNPVDLSDLKAKIKAMRTVGVPYEKGFENIAEQEYDKQAEEILGKLKAAGIKANKRTEIVALIAYLHKLGRDIEPKKFVQTATQE